MPKTSHLSERDLRSKHTSSGVRPSTVPGLLLGLGVLVVFVAILAIIFTPNSSAQGNSGNGESAFAKKADKMLHLVRKAHAHDLAQQRVGQPARGKSRLEALSKTVGVHPKLDGTATVDVAVKLAGESAAELQGAGFGVGARIGDMLTLQVDLARLDELASFSSVEKISAAVRRYPVNDRARAAIQVETLQGERFVSQTGQGVVVAVIDTGIDFRHADFTVPGSGGRQTRIKALLDMTVYGAQSPDPGWNYILPGQSAPIGHLYTESDLNAALQVPKPDQSADSVKQRDKNGHGTHVAGTAAGNGLSSPTVGTYNGMAPEADLIVVKASRQNDNNASFLTTDIINALQFVQQKAGELNKPFVINLSLGGQTGPHDGTAPDERAIDNLVDSGPGRAVCVAAGNEGHSGIHARATVPAGGDLTLDLNVNGAAEIVDLYQAHADRFSVTVTSPNGVTLGPVAYDANGFSFPNGQASNQYLDLFNANDNKGDSDPNNDQPDIVLLFNPGAPTGIWKIKLQDADTNANQDFDAWTEGDNVRFSSHVDDLSHLIASPGTARRAITVGAFVTRSESFGYGNPAPFTSPGPTADGRLKPDISAPGLYLYSARSTDVADPNFGIIGGFGYAPTDPVHYTGLAGTSMSTPVTAGSVALFMQSDLTLSSDQIKLTIQNTAIPGYAPGWGREYGFGKVNIRAAIELGGGPTYTISGHIDGFVVVTLEVSGSQTQVAGLDGQRNYQFRNLRAGGTYTVTPTIQSPYPYSITPASYTFTNLSENKTADFSIASITHTVSGRITDANGNGLAGIRVGSFFNPPAFTDANGYYQMTGLPHGSSQRIRPENPDYSFDPVESSFFINEDRICNFTARQLLKINGRVTDENGVGLPDSYVYVFSGTTSAGSYTNSSGDYQIDRLPPGLDYSVVTEGFNRTFTPAGVVLPNLSANQTVNFTRLPGLGIYTIGGRISDSGGVSLVGVRVNLSGDGSGATLTNANGFYHFNVEPGRNYTVTPTSLTMTFAPPAVSFTNLANHQMVDFVSQPANSQSQVRFASEVFSATEGSNANVVTVIRLGSTDTVATVNYATSDNAGLNNCNVVNSIASSRCDYATSVGKLTFAPGEVSKNISIPIVHDSFSEGFESFNVHLSGAVGAILSNNNSALVRITDTWSSGRLNPIGDVAFFVRQHYIDFLGRDPDPAGFTGWQNVINNCAPGDTNCDRIHVSRNFYQSPEFQQRGYFVYRFYPVSFGRKPDYAEFVPDLARVSGFLDDTQLEAAKAAFVNDFMARPIFASTYNSLNNTQYVDTLISTAGVTLTSRQALIEALSAGTKTRAQVLREIVESSEVSQKYFNQAFVVMQYFGYLRRDPDVFYLDWIQVLNTTGDSRGMINGFVNSLEYRFRFGP